MDRIKDTILTLNYIISTKRNRHVIGGVLLSVSMFFGGIALTVMSIKDEEDRYE